MNKISIFSKNSVFAEDFAQQLERGLPQTTVLRNECDGVEYIVFVDEDKDMLKRLSEEYKELPLVYLSHAAEIVPQADLVIPKPLRLVDVLSALKNNLLLPKVRRKTCLNIREYSVYPVRKEVEIANTKTVIKLTEKEVDIIKYLYGIAPHSADKEDLLANVWNYSNGVTTHTIETHIYRLRQKVEKDGNSQLIITENNGYRLNI